MELDFEIDKITESIENADTGESLDPPCLARNKSRLGGNRMAIFEADAQNLIDKYF